MSARASKSETNNNDDRPVRVPSNTTAASPRRTGVLHPVLERTYRQIQRADYRGAADSLRAAGYDVPVRNTLGVCLMRSGQIDEAARVYRQFVLQPGGIFERPDVSNLCKRNFATALLLKGLPSGAIAVLAGTREREHPMAVRIDAAIKDWEKSLSWLRWLDWKINAVEPPNCQVPLGFDPGEFDFDLVIRRPDEPLRDHLESAA